MQQWSKKKEKKNNYKKVKKKITKQNKKKRQIKKDKQMNINSNCDFGSYLPLVLRPITA